MRRGENTRQLVRAHDIALTGLMAAVIEVSKLALSALPNIELTSFWIIMFTLCFGRRVLFVVPVFIIIEGAIYGFGLWWLMYLYAWPLLALMAWLCRRQSSALFWALLSGAFGLCFGALCALPYYFIGAAGGGGAAQGLRTAFAWWVAGIPWDMVHCVGNFAIMLALYKPMRKTMERLIIKKGW